MILSVDVMGFENPIEEAIKACRNFIKKNKNVTIILVGNKNKITNFLKKEDNFEIVHAEDEIKMVDTPLSARNKKNSSMYKAIELVRDNKADGVLSAGNTACYVFLTLLLLQKLPLVTKCAFMPFIPTRNKKGLNILDVGANKTVNANDLICFAKMGDIYLKKVKKITSPTIGILNIGTEDNKGFDYQIEANKILKNDKNLNYLGFVESRNLLEGECRLVVTDGYSGNIFLKSLEGTFKTVINSMFDFYKKPIGWLGFLFSIFVLIKLKNKYDYKNNAGAIVLGLKKIAVKTHGSADYKQFYSSLKALKEIVDSNFIKILTEEFSNDQ